MPKKQTSQYMLQYQYYLQAASINVKSVPICYYKGHEHGRRPTENDRTNAKNQLKGEVQRVCRAKEVDYPGDAAVESDSIERLFTRK